MQCIGDESKEKIKRKKKKNWMIIRNVMGVSQPEPAGVKGNEWVEWRREMGVGGLRK